VARALRFVINTSPIALASAIVVLAIEPTRAQSPNSDPLAIVRNFYDAQHKSDVEAALMTWSDDGVFVTTRGQRRDGREQLKAFIQTAIKAGIHHNIVSPQVEGDRATWFEDEVTGFYQRLGVAPVRTVNDALVQGGKIKTLVVHFPLGEIARIEQACGSPTAEGILMFGLTCAEFVRLARAHTESLERK
jgi:hypothetical protein